MNELEEYFAGFQNNTLGYDYICDSKTNQFVNKFQKNSVNNILNMFNL